MKEKLGKLVEVGKKAGKYYSETEMSVYAGYATVFILSAALPMMMLLIAAVGMMPGFSAENFTDTLMQLLPDLPEVQSLILGIISNLKTQSSGLLASVAALTTLWSASGGVSALQKGLLKITPGAESSIKDKPRALVFTVLFTIMFMAILVFQVLGSTIRNIILNLVNLLGVPEVYSIASRVLQVSSIITLVFTVLILALAYDYLPGGERPFKKQIPGALFSALAWVIFSIAFAFFISRFWGASSIYGSLASIFLITLWLRLILSIFFLGAALNRVLNEGDTVTEPQEEQKPDQVKEGGQTW